MQIAIEIGIAVGAILLSAIGALWLSLHRLYQVHVSKLDSAIADIRTRVEADGRLLVKIQAAVDSLMCRSTRHCVEDIFDQRY